MRGFTVVSTIVLVIVVVVVVIAAALLARTVRAAQKINTKAQNIAKNGTGINTSTDSVIQLRRTNTLARSILSSATPLQGQLSGIVTTAQDINGLAGSINSTAGSINSTAGAINTTAGAINSTAGAINSTAGTINTQAGAINTAAGSINTSANSINSSAGTINSSAGAIDSTAGAINRSAGSINTSVRSIRTSARRINSDARSIKGTAELIDTDVRLINQNLDVTLSLVTAVKGDTASILRQAVAAHDTAACIDFKLFGTQGGDGDCQDRPIPARSGAAELRSTMPDGDEDSKGALKPSQAEPEVRLPGLPPLPTGSAETPDSAKTPDPAKTPDSAKAPGPAASPSGPAQSPDSAQSPPASTGSPPKTGIEAVDQLLNLLPGVLPDELEKLVPGLSGGPK